MVCLIYSNYHHKQVKDYNIIFINSDKTYHLFMMVIILMLDILDLVVLFYLVVLSKLLLYLYVLLLKLYMVVLVVI